MTSTSSTTTTTTKRKLPFLKPQEDESSWTEDKPDIDTNTGTAFIFNPNHNFSLDQQRQKLPIYRNRDHITYLLEKYQTLVLVGETGCGKSTQVPQYLYEAGWALDGKMIGVTQPRRVAATTLASRVADEIGTIVGYEVGYSIRFDERFDPKTTKIKYLTEGLLIREMMGDPLLGQYSIIMLDEVHERTVNIDILMGLLRKVLKKRRDLKLIVSSATVDAEEIQEFFNIRDSSSKSKTKKDTAVILSVSGRTHPVEVFYVEEPVPNYVKASVETAIKIHQTEERGDILIFLTGQDEVDQAITLLKQYSDELKGKHKLDLMPLPMYGALPHRDQLKVFQFTPKGMRKIIAATNIAETSITVHGIVFVIDCGFVKMKWYNPGTFTDSLVVVPISKASAEQRAGRAGRTQSGKVYRLYQDTEFEKFPQATPPEMQRSDLSFSILQLKVLGIDNLVRFHFPSAPPSKNLVCGVELLYALGAMDVNGKLTELGEKMAEFPLNPTFSKILLSSGDFECSEEITTIIAMLQVESVFVAHFGQTAIRARIAKRKFEVAEGDLITLLNVYNAFMKNGETKQFCGNNFINYKRLRRAQEIRKQMCKMLKRFKIPIVSCGDDIESILKCITSGLFPNAVYLHHSGVYKTVRGDLPVFVHPASVLYTLPQPQWLLFSEIIHTTQVHIRDLTVIESSWLDELAPHFYQKVIERHNT